MQLYIKNKIVIYRFIILRLNSSFNESRMLNNLNLESFLLRGEERKTKKHFKRVCVEGELTLNINSLGGTSQVPIMMGFGDLHFTFPSVFLFIGTEKANSLAQFTLGDKTFREFKNRRDETKLETAYVITLLIEAFFVP